MTSFLQSPAWEQFQTTQGRQTFRSSGDGWQYLAIKESGTGNSRLYVPYGPSFTSPDAFSTAVASLKELARKENVTFLRIEPNQPISPTLLRAQGFTPVNYQQLQPSHTQVIDLTLSEDELLAQMSQNSRNITRNIEKKNVHIRKSYDPADMTILTSLLQKIAARNHISVHSPAYFNAQATTLLPKKAAVLFIAEIEGVPIAAALAYDTPTSRTYGHAAADDTYRKLQAGTALVGRMILDAKQHDQLTFDLYGIAPSDDPKHPWQGFTRFKKSFGGISITHPGAWDLPLRRGPYLIYRIYQKLLQVRRSLR